MPMYNLLEYSDHYSMTSGSLWKYYKDEVSDSADGNNDANTFRINSNKTTTNNNAKLYLPVVTLSINDNINFLENIKQGFKRAISWNKYISEITTQPPKNNLDYLIDWIN